MTNTFSVVIPVYNGRRYLRRAVLSALAQTRPPLEVVVVDDGSTDGTRECVADLAGKIRYLTHERNRGLSAARNTGIRAAAGGVVALLDSDDEWRPEKLAFQGELFDADPGIGAVFCDFVHRWPDGSPAQWRGGMAQKLRGFGLALEGGALGGDVAAKLVEHTSFVHPSTLAFRRELFDRAGPFDESLRSMEDLEMWVRMAKHARFGFADAVLVDVEQRADSLGHNVPKAAEHLLKIYERFEREFAPLAAPTRRGIARQRLWAHASLAWAAYDRGDPASARRHYRAALKLGGGRSAFAGWLKSMLPRRGVAALRSLKGRLRGASE